MVESMLAQGYSIFPMAQTIADTKFRLPEDTDITEEEAVSLAVQAVKKAQGFQDGWENGYNIGRSLLDDEEGLSIWRITFWIKDRSKPTTYGRGRVQLDAVTGEVLSCDADGTTFDTSVPYAEMIEVSEHCEAAPCYRQSVLCRAPCYFAINAHAPRRLTI